jgi:hypothetical protein
VHVNAFIIELENRPGSLASVAEAIAQKGINITGVSGATVGNQGSVTILTNDESGTRSALEGAGFAYREIGLVAAAIEDKPGTLAALARRLADAGVNIETMIPTGMDGGKFSIAIGVSDTEAARRSLGELAAVGI